MNLDKRARENVDIPLTDIPAGGTLHITFDNGTTWTAVTAVAGEVTVLLAGPDATGNPGGTFVLPLGRSIPKFRSTVGDEILIRTSSGAIDVE